MDSVSLPSFISALNLIGVFVFAISGAVAGIKRKTDFVGVLILSFAAAGCGGIMRDVLLGALPPENITSWELLAVSQLAGLFTYFCFPLVNRLNNPVQIFDAFGLGLFTVLGVTKALQFGITPVWAVLLGVLTGVGGGVLRDMLVAQVPMIMRGEIYATASIAGGGIVAGGLYWNVMPMEMLMVLGAVVCTSVRLLALRYNWAMPVSKYYR